MSIKASIFSFFCSTISTVELIRKQALIFFSAIYHEWNDEYIFIQQVDE